MSSFKQIKFNDTQDKGIDSKDNLKKSLLTFKLQKNPSKIKTILHGSVTRVFFNPKLQSPSTQSRKNMVSNALNDSEFETKEVKNEIEKDKDLQLFYKEPLWSGKPNDVYKIEVLKSGIILETFDLFHKNYYVIGMSLSCDILLNHETISEFHAILQFRKISDLENEKGIYIYDLNSLHGTFLNGNRIESNKYIHIDNGNILSFGISKRKYILQIVKDNDKKTMLPVEEIKELQENELDELNKIHSLKENENSFNQELGGINWGIKEDLDENSKLTDNSENFDSDNEDLFFDDPKKALKDWFKWEGYDLEYQTEDRGFGQYFCYVDLTLDPVGTTERVEVNVVGDKMKAIDECALKACKILNEYGFLRQAYEEKKSTFRNWEEVDFYDSDEDNFLDRTGIIEKKRQQRMLTHGKLNPQIRTCESLFQKHTEISTRIENLEKLIASQKVKQDETENPDEDALDIFMSKLDKSTLNKSDLCNMQLELRSLRQKQNAYFKLNSIFSQSLDQNITEKTKNGCRFDN